MSGIYSEKVNANMLAEAESKLAELKRHLRDRDRMIQELEDELRAKDAIIADKSQLIERLEQWYPETFAADVVSVAFAIRCNKNSFLKIFFQC